MSAAIIISSCICVGAASIILKPFLAQPFLPPTAQQQQILGLKITPPPPPLRWSNYNTGTYVAYGHKNRPGQGWLWWWSKVQQLH